MIFEIVLASLSLTGPAQAAADAVICQEVGEAYSIVLKEQDKKTDFDEIYKLLRRKNNLFSDSQVNEIILQAKQLSGIGWTNERIVGFMEGICMATPPSNGIRTVKKLTM